MTICIYQRNSAGQTTACSRNRTDTCKNRPCSHICRSCKGSAFARTRSRLCKKFHPVRRCTPVDTRTSTSRECFGICRSGKSSDFRNTRRRLQQKRILCVHVGCMWPQNNVADGKLFDGHIARNCHAIGECL